MGLLSLNTEQIIDLIEIKPPLLMVDYVKEVIPGKSCHSIKVIKKEDWFFDCHIERKMIMPGVLLIESMLQTLILAIYTMDGHKGKLTYVTDINTKLLSKVLPDSKLHIYANLVSCNRGISKGNAKIKVNEIEVCKGEFTFLSPHNMPIPNKK